MSEWILRESLRVAHQLTTVFKADVLLGTSVTPAQFWAGIVALVTELEIKNLNFRLEHEKVKAQLDNLYILNRSVDFNFETFQTI